METFKITLIVFLVLFLCFMSYYFGDKFYKYNNDGKFQDNVITMMNNMKQDLYCVETKLLKNPTDQDLKTKLLKRRSKLVSDLNLFYGYQAYT